MSDDLGQRRLAGSRRPVKDDGTDPVGFDRPVEQLIRRKDMLLPHHLFQCLGPDPRRQRRLLLLILLFHVFKKIHIRERFFALCSVV